MIVWIILLVIIALPWFGFLIGSKTIDQEETIFMILISIWVFLAVLFIR